MTRALISMLAIALLVVSCRGREQRSRSGERRGEQSGQSTANAGPPAPANHELRFDHDGAKRRALVHLPPASHRTPLPAVLMIHGGGGNADASASHFAIDALADREGFIVVYPEGTGRELRGKLFGTWNAGRCCSPAKGSVDDVGYFRKLLDRLSNSYGADPKRIYAAGHSNGALMSYRLACEMADRIAAIGVAGAHDAMPAPCAPSRAVPVLHMHGTEDRCALYQGGECGGCFANFLSDIGLPTKPEPWTCSSVPDYLASWRKLNGCNEAAKVSHQQGAARCVTHADCRDGAEVVLCSIDGAGHVWPGNKTYGTKFCDARPTGKLCRAWKKQVGELSTDLNANEQIWAFFERHALP